jgi:hypothetical protein
MFYPLAFSSIREPRLPKIDQWNDSDEKVDEAPLLDGETGA